MRSAPFSALALGLALATPLAALAAPSGQITVTGEASVSAVPDMATVSLGVTTIATSAAGALAANSAAIAAVTRRLDAMKVPAQDIRTSGLSLRPNYAARTESQPAQITGYTASNTLTITLNQIDKTGAILDAAVRDGANRLESLSFGLANPAPQQTRARKAAVADARARAQTLAAAAGVKLGPIISITEGGPARPPVMALRAEAAMPVPISTGTLDVSESVTVVWSLEQ